MASANSANNSSAINLQNESTLLDINDIRDYRLAIDEHELKLVLFLGGYTDNPEQIANIKMFLDENQDTILIIFDGASKGFAMMKAFQPDYKYRIFFICGDIYDIKIWKLFKINNFFFNKIIVDYSVIYNNNIINYIDKPGYPNIENILKWMYICLSDEGLLYLYDASLNDGYAFDIIKEKYALYGYEIEKINYQDYPIINSMALPGISICAKKSKDSRRIFKNLNGGGSKQKNKLKTKTKRKSKSGSRTKRKSKSKSKSKN